MQPRGPLEEIRNINRDKTQHHLHLDVNQRWQCLLCGAESD